MEKEIEKILEKGIEDITDEEIDIIEEEIERIEKHLNYCDRRDKVCLAIDGEQERYELETELAKLKNFLYGEE